MRTFEIPGLVPAPAPGARDYRRAAVVLAIATGFKFVAGLAGMIQPTPFFAGLLFGAPTLDLVFVALAVHWRMETIGVALGTLMLLLDALAAFVPVIPFANPGYRGGSDSLLAALCAIYGASFASGATGTLLLRRSARRAAQVETQQGR